MKELNGEKLIKRPKDFACMRLCHRWLDSECGIMGSEYALTFNIYVIDFCETTAPEN